MTAAPLLLDELRQVLVVEWCVISPERWETLVSHFSSADLILDQLAGATRFSLYHRDPLPYITPDLRLALHSAAAAKEMVMQLDGRRWLKVHQLEGGGQGEIWIGCPCNCGATIDQLVALKSPNPRKGDPVRIIRRLQLEIEILQKIDCEYVVRLVAADPIQGLLATQFVDGDNLEELAQARRRLSVVEVLHIGIDICRALEALHSEGWIHKDVKPANIMLRKDKRAILIDFGYATIPDHRLLDVVGTPYYIAPEVFFPENKPDAKADVYSLAATLYRLLSGLPPHFQHCLHPHRPRGSRAELDAHRFRLVSAATECDPADLRKEVPRQLCQLLCRSLSANSESRHESAFLFRSALENIRSKLDEAVDIEQELWKLSEILLEVIRSASYDADYASVGKENRNAASIRDQLQRALAMFPALLQLQKSASSWTGIESAYAVVPQTIKIITKLEALGRQLDAYLSTSAGVMAHGRSSELLKDLIVRTLEGTRAISVEAVAAAHAWRTVLQQLGLFG